MKHKIPTLLCLLLALASCGKSSLETTFANQSTKIDTYVTKQLESHPEYRVEYNDGVVRMVVAEGEGTELAKGGSVTFYYAGYNFNNNSISAGTMFATNDQDIAAGRPGAFVRTGNWLLGIHSPEMAAQMQPIEIILK